MVLFGFGNLAVQGDLNPINITGTYNQIFAKSGGEGGHIILSSKYSWNVVNYPEAPRRVCLRSPRAGLMWQFPIKGTPI